MQALETALYSLLSTNTALTTALGGTAVYNSVVPPGTARPYIVFFHAGGGRENVFKDSLMENHVYMVKAVADALSTAAALDGTLDTLLHRNEGSLSVTDHTTLWIARENEAHVVEAAANGDRIFHVGAYYRFRLDVNET